jgi:galactofuranose transport system substrate-binding protein
VRRSWPWRRVVGALAVLGTVVILATQASAGERRPAAQSLAGANPATQKVLAFDKRGVKPTKRYQIAYLTECINNPYCESRLNGLKAAAKKYGFTFKIYDANFNPATQLKLTQDAAAKGFDGYLFAPAAAAPGCSTWKRYLKPTNKPVVSLDLPMCGDADYTPGLAATVTMQRQSYFNQHINNAFSSCKTKCKVAAVGGFTGSDLFGDWERAIQQGKKKYPNVEVVTDQPGNFDPRVALKVIGDALQANPDISLVVSSWDDMTRGVEQAITAAGKKPGKDVKIYSVGGTKVAMQRLKRGTWNESTVLLPFEESYYAAVALIMALQGKPVNGYVSEAQLPTVTKLGTIFVTKKNAAKFHPNY